MGNIMHKAATSPPCAPNQGETCLEGDSFFIKPFYPILLLFLWRRQEKEPH